MTRILQTPDTEKPTPSTSAYPKSRTEQGPSFRHKLTEEEVARRAKLSNVEKQKEAQEARAAWEKERKDTWWHAEPSKKSTKPSTHPDPKPSTGAAKQFFKSTVKPEKTEQESKQKRRQKEKSKKREAKKEEQRQEQIASTLKAQLHFQTWSQACHNFFANSSQPFPQTPTYGCKENRCIKGELVSACHHDMERTMIGSGCYSKDWLKKERLKWHPDKFHGMGGIQEMAAEMFVLIQRLIDGDKKK